MEEKAGAAPRAPLVLVAEDESIIALDLKARLEHLGYEVPEPVSTGEEAVRSARSRPPDLLIMDIRLAGAMDGIEASKRIREMLDVPVVYLTASTDGDTLRRSLATNPSGYVHKPVEAAALRYTVEMALYRHGMERRVRESEELYRATIENISDAVFLTDEQGGFIFICPNVDVIFGHSYDEVSAMGSIGALMGEAILAHVPPHGVPEVSNIDFEITGKDGTQRLLLVNIKRVSIKNATLLFTCRNVTERRALEGRIAAQNEELRVSLDEREAANEELTQTVEELEATNEEFEAVNEELNRVYRDLEGREQLLRGILQTVPVGIVLVRDRTINWCNRSFHDMLGYPPNEVLGRDARFLYFDDAEYERVGSHYARARGGEVVTLEARMRHREGREMLVLLSGMFVNAQKPGEGSVITLHDVTEHRRADRELHRASQELERFFAGSLDLLCIADTKGYFRRLNPEWEKTLGYTPEELEGKRFLDFVHPDDLEATLAVSTLSDQGEVLDFTNRYRHRDGTWRWIEWRSYPSGDLIYAAARDVTERVRAREELEESARRYRSVIENSPLGFHLYRLEEGDRLVFTGANPAADRMLGVDHGMFTGKTIEEAFPPLEATDIPSTYKLVAREGGVRQWSQVDYRDEIINGAFEVTVFQSVPREIAVAFDDITERTRAQEMMRLSEERYRLIFTHSPMGVLHFDAQGVIKACNDNFVAIIGSSQEALVGLDMMKLPDRKIAEAVREALDGRKGTYEGVYHSVTAKKVTPVRGMFAPLKSVEGAIMGGVGIFEDVTARKKAEDALRESESRYRTLFDTMVQGIVYQDAQGWIVHANPTAEKILGLSLEEMKTRTSDDSQWRAVREDGSGIPGEQHPAMVALRTGSEVRDTVMGVFNPRLNRTVWLKISAVPQFREGEDAPWQVYTIFEDITARRESERALKETGERNRSLINANPDLMFVLTPEGRFVDCKAGSDSRYYAEPEEFLGKLVPEVLPPEVAGIAMEKISRVMETGSIETFNYSLDMKEGPRNYEARMLPYGDGNLLVIVRDITEFTRMERMLYGERDRAQQYLDIAGVMILALDRDARVTMINRRGCEILGYPEGEIKGKNWIADFTPPEDRERISGAFARILDGEIERAGYGENHVLCRDGSRKLIAWHNTTIRDAGGNITGTLSSGEDITVRARAEQEIVRSLAEKEVLLKEIHHRVKNNMQVMSSLLALQSHQVKDEQVKSFFRDSQNRIWAMAQVHERLYRSDNLASINFREYVAGLVRELAAGYNFSSERVRVEMDDEGQGALIGIDEAVPCGLLVNELVSNAMKHAFPGVVRGTITVSFTRTPAGKRSLSVRDEGKGLPDGFNPGSSGSLGMRLVRALTAQLGGELSMTGTDGTRVEIIF